ncbi:MAG: GGDEF domain-containing protein [Planctomycetaceae bacterium]|nr:GGDEF domain-containing protein [Planctomycetaceae bacterium]
MNLTRSLKLRVILLFMAALIGVIAVIHSAIYFTTRRVIENEIKLNAQALAVSVACNIIADIEEYKSFLDKPDVHGKYYQRMRDFFADIKANSNVRYIYTERRVNEKTTEFILCAEPTGSTCYSPPGMPDPNDSDKEFVFSHGIPTMCKLVKFPRWGHLLGAFAPILDVNGDVLGIVGVDIDASKVHHYLSQVQVVLFGVYGVILGVTLLVLNKYADVFLEPLLRDKLTGAYSKRYTEKLIQKGIAAAARERKDSVLMMLDLDHFKTINDTYGHAFGDKTLSSSSEAIKLSLRENDYFIRYGGEEFIVLIPGATEKLALEIAERIRRAVEANEIFNEEKNVTIQTTVSIGVTKLNDPTVSVREFINQADKALYNAKKNRNCVSVFVPEMMVERGQNVAEPSVV